MKREAAKAAMAQVVPTKEAATPLVGAAVEVAAGTMLDATVLLVLVTVSVEVTEVEELPVTVDVDEAGTTEVKVDDSVA